MKDHRFLMYFVCKFSFCFEERESTYGPRFEFLTTSAAKEFVDLAMTTMSSIAAKRRISQSFGISASSLPRLLLAQSYAVGYGRTVYARGKVPWVTPGVPGVLNESSTSCSGNSGKPSNGHGICLMRRHRQNQRKRKDGRNQQLHGNDFVTFSHRTGPA